MPTAKDIRVTPISGGDACAAIKKLHYSGKFVQNSQLHLGVFLGTRLEGVMQFGPPLDRRKLVSLVEGTVWNGMLELNRMAFSDNLPRNSESRALGVAMRLLRKEYPWIEWVVSFADATQCGDGTIYRAAGFVLTGWTKNKTIWVGPNEHKITDVGERTSMKKIQTFSHVTVTANGSGPSLRDGMEYKGGASMSRYRAAGYRPLEGFQFRYIYFVNPAARARLTVPILPFSEIERLGASMYRGKRVGSIPAETAVVHTEEGGSTPTPTLQTKESM